MVSQRITVIRFKYIFIFLSITLIAGSCQNFSETSNPSHQKPKVKKPHYRVFVLGLDGFTWALAKPWMEQGKLPKLKKFTDENAWGNLQSVPPYNSPTAWGSAITGVNPGKHGVYSFFQSQQLRNDFTKRQIYFINSFNYQVPFIWDILSTLDYRVIAINVPGSSPPQPLNGYMIAGQPYLEGAPVTYPNSLIDSLPDFRIEEFSYYCEEGKEDTWLKECYEIERGRVKTMFQLMKQDNWDLFWAVLTSPDRVQHHFWKYMDPNHPLYTPEKNKKYGDEILKIYRYMDEVLGRLLSELPDDVVLIIMSDHGFGPVYKTINVADFLFGDEKLTDMIARTVKVNYNSFFTGSFYINLRIREPYGTVNTEEYEQVRDYLLDKLKNLKDPDTEQPVIDKIFKREDLFSGPYSYMAPDIFCIEKPTYLFSGIKVKPDGKMIENFPSFAISGGHRPEGIIAIGGKPIREHTNLTNSQIADITPTILYLMGLDIPPYLDGFVLDQAIQKDYIQVHPPKTSGTQTSTDREQLDRLRKLGYIK